MADVSHNRIYHSRYMRSYREIGSPASLEEIRSKYLNDRIRAATGLCAEPAPLPDEMRQFISAAEERALHNRKVRAERATKQSRAVLAERAKKDKAAISAKRRIARVAAKLRRKKNG